MAVLIDTGVFYALFDKRDARHRDSAAILAHSLKGRFGRPYTTDYVVLETTTLLKVRAGPEVAKAFLDFLEGSGIEVLVTDEGTFRKAVRIFKELCERLSLRDAVSLIVMKELGMRTIATYDERSFSGLVKNIIGRGYFEALAEEERREVERLLKEAEI